MKLPQLLAHYLYKNKKLSLPGLGVFSLDPSTIIPQELVSSEPETIQGIHFENTLVQRPDDSLIEFLHEYTGKMKPLAASDLESYLNLGIQLINIGKPFHLEGIGSVYRNQDNKFEFQPGEFSYAKLILPEVDQLDSSEKRKTNYEVPVKEDLVQPVSARRVFIALGILAGIALIGWGGYSLYKKKTSENGNQNNMTIGQPDTSSRAKDSLALIAHQTDSLNKRMELEKLGLDSNSYRFVILATPNRKRAERRYQQLALSSSKVKMETKDSTIFKVYFPILAISKDTSKIKDSLNAFFATKTFIEK